MKRIVVGVDGSEHADRALDAAARLSASTGAELTVVAVSRLPQVLDDEIGDYAKAEHATTQEFRDIFVDPRPPYLHRARERASAAGAKGVETVVMIGDAAEGIVEAANRRHASLIVVGKRGRGRIAGLICGSVSQKAIQIAACPVMVIP